MSDGELQVQPNKPITVERWLNKMWLEQPPRHGQRVKPRRALTVVRKKQGVPVMIVNEEDQWDTCTRIAENPETKEAIMAFYRKITDLQMKVTPGKDRVAVVPILLWKKMIGTNLFISQFKKDKDELADGLQGGTEESS
jgi:hypothetical protein